MPDNFNDDIIETLIKYADNELGADEKETMEKLLQNNVELRERYEHIVAAKRTVRSQALKQRVRTIHNEYMQEIQPAKKESEKIIKPSFLKNVLRVAAVFFIAVAGYAVFLYSTTTNQSEYNSNYVAYRAVVNRGDETTNNLVASYNAGSYKNAIDIFNSIENKNQQDYFIAAQSYLQLNNPSAAISAFIEIKNLNDSSSEKYFEQETDYYLMLAYIKNGEISKAENQLRKITSNKQHLFYSNAKNISATKLKILEWKNK